MTPRVVQAVMLATCLALVTLANVVLFTSWELPRLAQGLILSALAYGCAAASKMTGPAAGRDGRKDQ